MARLSLVLAVLVLVGCTENSPRATAEGYLQALSHLDFSGAAQFVDDDGRANFDMLNKVYSGLDPVEQKKFQVTNWQITAETVSGDSATVDFTFDGEKSGELSLKRISGVWRVDHRQTF